MGHSRCFVPRCTFNTKHKNKISLFSVTENNLKAWRDAVPPRANRVLSLKDKLCELHFSKDDVIREVKTDVYCYNLKKPRLRENAVPCIWTDLADVFVEQAVDDQIEPTMDQSDITVKQEVDDSTCFNIIENEKLEQSTLDQSDDGFVEQVVHDTKCFDFIETEEIQQSTLDQSYDGFVEQVVDDIKCFDVIENEEIEQSTFDESDDGFVDQVVHEILENDGIDPVTLKPLDLSDTFASLWHKEKLVDLPSKFWSVVFIPSKEEENLIVFLETKAIENDALVVKKVVVSPSFINFYIFENPYKISYKNLTVGAITQILKDFNEVCACYGFTSKKPVSLRSLLYKRDEFSKSWRHKYCKYIVTSRKSKTCNLCQNARLAVRYHANTKPRKKLSASAKREAYNRRRRELRLQNKFKKLTQLATVIK